jgi:multidrug efflux pump subunit AcrA (membrane-fusion protein)
MASDSLMAGRLKATNPVLLIFLLIPVSCENNIAVNPGSVDPGKAFSDTTRVTATVLTMGDFTLETLSQGQIITKEKADVVLPAGDMIEKIAISRGQRVEKGQILATLDATKWQQEYELLQAEMDEKKLQLEAKLLALGYDENNQPPTSLREKVEIELGIPTLKKRIAHKDAELAEKEIKAPISGIVTSLEARAGNPTAGFEKLCTIINDRKLEVKFPILESEITLIKRGMKIAVTPFYDETSSKATISSFDPMVDQHGLVWVYADLFENHGQLLDGMKVKIAVEQVVPNQRVLPKSAILDRQDRYVTFVYKGGEAHWVYAHIDQENSKEYSLSDEGPQPGDTVIISNNFDLSHLEPVVIDSIITLK